MLTGLTIREQRTLLVLLAFLTAGMALRHYSTLSAEDGFRLLEGDAAGFQQLSQPQQRAQLEGMKAPNREPGDSLIDINSAEEAQLTQLPRIGPKTAAQIIAWRQANGDFHQIEDIMKVPGIGPKTFDGFRELITAGGDGARPMPQSQATKASTGPETSLNAPVTTYPSTGETGLIININTATQADFESLPGIGPAIAEKIIQYRQAHGPFQSTRDLRKVSGIGEKKLEKLEPCIRVE